MMPGPTAFFPSLLDTVMLPGPTASSGHSDDARTYSFFPSLLDTVMMPGPTASFLHY